MKVSPSRASPELMVIRVHARPMTALAWLNGLSAPRPEFMPISSRMGPFTMAMRENEVVELGMEASSLAASARMTGRCSGPAPAMTALTATFSTVYSSLSWSMVTVIRPTTSVGVGGGAGEHPGHPLLRGEHDGQTVGPVGFQEQPVKVLLFVRLEQPRPGGAALGLRGASPPSVSGRVSASTIWGMSGLPVTGSLPSTYLRRTSRGLPTSG